MANDYDCWSHIYVPTFGDEKFSERSLWHSIFSQQGHDKACSTSGRGDTSID
jgi:hypothetical protein